METNLSEEQRYVIARNVRVLMALQDVNINDLAYILGADKATIGQKVNGKKDFNESEMKRLAEYFNTTVQSFTGDMEKNPPAKYGDNVKMALTRLVGSPLITVEVATEKVKENSLQGSSVNRNGGRKNREQSALGRLLRLVEEDGHLRKLLEKTYMAAFTGRMKDLGYYLRHNVLVRALTQFEPAFAEPLVEGDKTGFVDHYLEQYETWKTELTEDDDEVFSIQLKSDRQEDVIAVLGYGKKDGLYNLIKELVITHSNSSGTVDMAGLRCGLEKSINDIGGILQLWPDRND